MTEVSVSRMSKETKKPLAFSYFDYRLYLRDWFSYLKSKKKFSLRQFSKANGVAQSTLSMLVTGNRNLSDKLWAKISKILEKNGISQSEVRFLGLLRDITEASDQTAIYAAVDRLQKYQRYHQHNPKESDAYQYLAHWYYVVIREMAGMPNFHLDARWIQQQLLHAVRLQEIEETLEFLVERKYILVAKDGTVSLPRDLDQRQVDCFEGIYRISLSKFYQEVLTLTMRTPQTINRDKFTLRGRTFSIQESLFPEVRAILDEAREKLQQLEYSTKNKSPNVVYQVTLGAIPMTKTKTNAKG